MPTDELCPECGGNGVVKIPGGVSECPACKGRCWAPVTEASEAARQRLERAVHRYRHDTVFHLLVDGFLDLLRGRAGQPPVTIDDIDEALVLVRKQVEQDRLTPLWTPPRF